MIFANVQPTTPGWNDIRFRYDKAVVEFIKEIPGCRWNPEKRVWSAPDHALGVLFSGLQNRVKFNMGARIPGAVPVPMFTSNLRPYQVEGVNRLLNSLGSGYLLSFDMRTGKTKTASAAAGSLLAQNFVRSVVLLYPSVAKYEWARQFPEQVGLDVVQLESESPLDPAATEYLRKLDHLAIGLHYELIRDKGDGTGRASELLALVESRGPFVVVSDETQYLKNAKSGRWKAASAISRSPSCIARFALTGTPQRNYPRDLFTTFDFIQPDSMGSRSKYGKRYCGAHQGDYGWVDDGETNVEELAARLALCSMRITRRDAAPWLPKTERRVVLCDMDRKSASIYSKAEAALGAAALSAMNDQSSSLAALRQLVKLATAPKLKTMMDRLTEHTVKRGVKVVVFANFHETLDEASTMYGNANSTIPMFIAGGWMTPDRRHKAIDGWKKHTGPAVLFANILSSGVGIDLSDADTAMFIELSWVPADFVQAEARISDVHQGKRTTPPMLEYLLTRATVDENMGMALLEKIRSIDRVVGANDETENLSSTLENSGLVNTNNLSLKSEDPEVVNAVLDKLRAKLFGDSVTDDTGEDTDNNVEEDDGDEEEAEAEEHPEV